MSDTRSVGAFSIPKKVHAADAGCSSLSVFLKSTKSSLPRYRRAAFRKASGTSSCASIARMTCILRGPSKIMCWNDGAYGTTTGSISVSTHANIASASSLVVFFFFLANAKLADATRSSKYGFAMMTLCSSSSASAATAAEKKASLWRSSGAATKNWTGYRSCSAAAQKRCARALCSKKPTTLTPRASARSTSSSASVVSSVAHRSAERRRAAATTPSTSFWADRRSEAQSTRRPFWKNCSSSRGSPASRRASVTASPASARAAPPKVWAKGDAALGVEYTRRPPS
mmetsp:Transcript_3806/g.15058  ORF Transcript_3806/g.15058 Transcript_3806/m.15058 type:complete len:286 (+) Transcript_3806:2058-2915(+)